MKTPEVYEKDAVKKYLDSIGAYHHWPVATGFGKHGLDCYACINGRFWGIEVKALGKQPTMRQKLCMEEIVMAGGYNVCGTSTTILNAISSYIEPRTRRL